IPPDRARDGPRTFRVRGPSLSEGPACVSCSVRASARGDAVFSGRAIVTMRRTQLLVRYRGDWGDRRGGYVSGGQRPTAVRGGRSWIQWGSAGPAGTAALHPRPLDGPAGVTASALDFVIGTSDGLDGAGQGTVAPAADLTREVADHPVGHPQAAGAGPGAGD